MGPSWPWSHGSWIYNYLCNQCLSSLMLLVRISIRARCTTLCDKVCQWLETGRWFSPGTPVSSTNKIDRHEITEILLKVALNTINLTKQTFWLTFYKLFTHKMMEYEWIVRTIKITYLIKNAMKISFKHFNQSPKIGKSSNLNVFRSKKIKET